MLWLHYYLGGALEGISEGVFILNVLVRPTAVEVDTLFITSLLCFHLTELLGADVFLKSIA